VAQLLLFGRLAERAGWRERDQAIPLGATVASLRAELAATEPALKTEIASKAVRAAVNHTLVGEDHALSDGDEIAFMPPFSGG